MSEPAFNVGDVVVVKPGKEEIASVQAIVLPPATKGVVKWTSEKFILLEGHLDVFYANCFTGE